MIRFENVTKTFSTGVTALSDVTFEIGGGELVVISGPSGAGKTTILRLLLRDVLPSSGTILLDDTVVEKVQKKDLAALRRKIGAVFQDFKILEDRTVEENISLVLEILGEKDDNIPKRIHEVLGQVGLSGKERVFPRQLSGGELQRVAIARALSFKPKVLFADEPTGNLDPETSRIIVRLLSDINQEGTTVVVATHDEAFIDELGGRLLAFDHGVLTLHHKAA